MERAFERVGSLISIWQQKHYVHRAVESIAKKEGMKKNSKDYVALRCELQRVVSNAEVSYGLVQEA